jgi:hypothetical protein
MPVNPTPGARRYNGGVEDVETASEDLVVHSVLWEAAREALRFLQMQFGGPAAMACTKVLAAARRADILAWLAPVEMLMRKLLWLEALALAPDLPTPCALKAAARTALGARRARAMEDDFESPAQRKARFAIGGGGSQASVQVRSGFHCAAPVRMRWAGTGVFPSLPIAKRLVAALRVVKNPELFALRLARRLVAASRSGRKLAPAARPGAGGSCRVRAVNRTISGKSGNTDGPRMILKRQIIVQREK